MALHAAHGASSSARFLPPSLPCLSGSVQHHAIPALCVGNDVYHRRGLCVWPCFMVFNHGAFFLGCGLQSALGQSSWVRRYRNCIDRFIIINGGSDFCSRFVLSQFGKEKWPNSKRVVFHPCVRPRPSIQLGLYSCQHITLGVTY